MYSKFYKVVIPFLLVIAFVRFAYASYAGLEYTTFNLTDAFYSFSKADFSTGRTLEAFNDLKDFFKENSEEGGDLLKESFVQNDLKGLLDQYDIDNTVVVSILSALYTIVMFTYFGWYFIYSVVVGSLWVWNLVITFIVEAIFAMVTFIDLAFSFFGMDRTA